MAGLTRLDYSSCSGFADINNFFTAELAIAQTVLVSKIINISKLIFKRASTIK